MKICITNRHLCTGDFFKTVQRACDTADMIILREKDLSEEKYFEYAEKTKQICKEMHTNFCINKYTDTAKQLKCEFLQLSYSDFTKLAEKFCCTGVSVHSVNEAVNAEKLGADFLIAGHIFATDCKKGVSPRGLKFLKEVCSAVSIPVYAIGGINAENEPLTYENGASGVCIMSGYMR